MISFPSQPPTASLPRSWSFPDTVIRQLANGLQVAVIRMPSLPIVSVRWAFLSGRLHEEPTQIGAGMLLQRMLLHGTKQMGSADLARHLDRRGARLGTQVSVDSTVVSISTLREYLGEALQLATDVALHPALPEPSLVMERIRALQLHQHERTQVESMASMWLSRALYGAHPYGNPLATHSGLESITREDLCSMHSRIADPSRAILLVTGDVESDAVMDVIARRLEGIDSRTSSALAQPEVPRPVDPGVWLVSRPGAEQTAIGVGFLATPRKHADFMSLRLVNRIFGGGASSRLFTELRERQGLTYGVYSTLDCGLWAGDLTVSMTVSPEKTGRAVSALAAEIERIGTGEISPAELQHGADYLVGSFPQRASGLAGVSSLTMAAWLHDLSPDVWCNYQADIANISLARASSSAQRWIRPERAAWVVAGPPEALKAAEAQLKALQRPIHRVEMGALLD
jgi:zinc protease